MFIDRNQPLVEAAPFAASSTAPRTNREDETLRVQANGVNHAVRIDGDLAGVPLLLIPGIGMQLVDWPMSFVNGLTDAGFRVIRYDLRDMGLSDSMDHLGKTHIAGVAMGQLFGVKSKVPYTLAELADDARALLRALGYEAFHVCGLSMGGMIAQHLATRCPQAVSSLCLLMTSSGSPWLPRPSSLLMHRLSSRPPSRKDMPALVRHFAAMHQAIASPAYPQEPEAIYLRVNASLSRSFRPQASFRQAAAVLADGDRTPLLRAIQAPTLVIHGKADPLVPHEAGRDLAKRIADSKLLEYEGMGHEIPVVLAPKIASAIAENARREVFSSGATH